MTDTLDTVIRNAQCFSKIFASQIIELLGCRCEVPTELNPTGYRCGYHRWADDTEAIVLALRTLAAPQVSPAVKDEIHALVEKGKQIRFQREADAKAAQERKELEIAAEWQKVIDDVRPLLPEAVRPFVIVDQEDKRPDDFKSFLRIKIDGYAPITFCAGLEDNKYGIRGLESCYSAERFSIPRAEGNAQVGAFWRFAIYRTETIEEALVIAFEQGDLFGQFVGRFGLEEHE